MDALKRIYEKKLCSTAGNFEKRLSYMANHISPYGILTNSSTDTSAMTYNATIVWSPMNYTEDRKCRIKKIHHGNGI
jgi:hypothetical protein